MTTDPTAADASTRVVARLTAQIEQYTELIAGLRRQIAFAKRVLSWPSQFRGGRIDLFGPSEDYWWKDHWLGRTLDEVFENAAAGKFEGIRL